MRSADRGTFIIETRAVRVVASVIEAARRAAPRRAASRSRTRN